jgi:hypothetical protein
VCLKADTTETDTPDMKFLRLLTIAALALATTACYGLDSLFNKLPTSASDTSSSTTVRSYLGTWDGPAAVAPGAQSCSGLQWKITSQTGTQITGDFTATCAGGITLVGTLVATITDTTTIPWAASGNAIQGTTSCTFNLTGTGTFQGTSNIVVNYSGTTCGVSVSGSETIKRS